MTVLLPSGDAILFFGLVLAAVGLLRAIVSLVSFFQLLFVRGAVVLRPLLHKFEETITDSERRLLELDEPEVQKRPAEGTWSKKEILGHLIDSASNNHQCFVRAQLSSEVKFPDYEPGEWVRLQNYQSESWSSLVRLWGHYISGSVCYLQSVGARGLPGTPHRIGSVRKF